MKYGSLLFLALIVFCPPTRAQSSVNGIIINADKSEHDTIKKIVHLSGNVQVVFKGNHLRCDAADIELLTKTVNARGRVVLDHPKAHMEGSHLQMNYETVTGTLYDGFVQSGKVTFEGAIIEKTGPEDYIAQNARYTACTDCPPDWSFSGRRIKATFGGYAEISYPVMRVRGIPMFVSPWLLVPLKSSRSSGFLVPSLNFSQNGGIAFEVPYFWAISRSQDATVTAKRYDKRGYKALLEHRYLLSDKSLGQFHGAYMYDQAFVGYNQNITPINRWFIDYHHYYDLPDNYVHRLKITAARDLRYQIDFPLELKGNGDAARENRMSLTKNTEETHASADTEIYVNQLKPDPLAINSDAVHRLPEFRYSVVRQKISGTPFVFEANLDYANFYRAGFSYDNVVNSCPPGAITPICILHGADKVSQANTGVFNPTTDIIRTGQRLHLEPKVSLPFRLFRVLDFLPSISYHEVQYTFNTPNEPDSPNSAARRFLETDFGVRTRLSSVYSLSSDPKADKIKHIIEPSVTYATRPILIQPNHPFFGDLSQPYARELQPITDNDFTGSTRVQFDDFDRIYNKRIVDMGVTNYWNRKRLYGSSSVYKNIVSWRLSEFYDLNEVNRDLRQPLSSVNSELDVRLDHFETYTTNQYYPYAKITNTSSRVRFLDDRGDFFELNYVRELLISLDNQVNWASKNENLGFNLGYVSRTLSLTGGLNFSVVTHTIQSWQYLANYRPYGGCWALQFGQSQVLGGDKQLNLNFTFDFGGHQTSPTKFN